MKTLAEIHDLLQRSYESLIALWGHLPPSMSADTAFALGEVTGQISKAKALIGRDIDDMRVTDKPD